MSAGLYWRPRLNAPEGERLGNNLKAALGELLWDQDGSLNSDWTVLGQDDERTLRAVVAGTRDEELRADVNALLGAIQSFGEVEVRISRG